MLSRRALLVQQKASLCRCELANAGTGKMLSNAVLCRRGLDERVPKIGHQKAAQQAAGADAATHRARSGLFWKLETSDRFPDLLVRRRSAA